MTTDITRTEINGWTVQLGRKASGHYRLMVKAPKAGSHRLFELSSDPQEALRCYRSIVKFLTIPARRRHS